jgi:hypothetical protein
MPNVILDTSPQGQTQLVVPFSVPFTSSNGKVMVNVAGNNPAYLRLWVNGIEVQKGTTLPTSAEFPVLKGMFVAGSNTLILGWGIGSSPSPPTVTILSTSSVTIITTGLRVTVKTTGI